MKSLILNFRFSISHIALAAAIFGALPSLAVGAEFSYTNDFNTHGAAAKVITTTPTSTNDYFSKYSEVGTWELINGRMKADWTGSQAGVSSFVELDFRDNNLLGSGQSIVNPSLTAATRWTNGNSGDAFLWNYFGFLNTAGQGYVAAVSRSGIVQFFEVNALSDESSWVLLGDRDINLRQGLSAQHSFTFSIQDDELTLVDTRVSDSVSASFSVALSSLKYSEFTTIVLGGKFGTGPSGSTFNINFDDLLVTGTSVPESSSVALVFGGGALAAMILFRKKIK